MKMALASGLPEAAQLVAAECVTLAETKDHMNWELIGQVAENIKGDRAKVLRTAYEEVEGDEDEHLYHSMGWGRELWIESLGMKAVRRPPKSEGKSRPPSGRPAPSRRGPRWPESARPVAHPSSNGSVPALDGGAGGIGRPLDGGPVPGRPDGRPERPRLKSRRGAAE